MELSLLLQIAKLENHMLGKDAEDVLPTGCVLAMAVVELMQNLAHSCGCSSGVVALVDEFVPNQSSVIESNLSKRLTDVAWPYLPAWGG